MDDIKIDIEKVTVTSEGKRKLDGEWKFEQVQETEFFPKPGTPEYDELCKSVMEELIEEVNKTRND